MSLCDWFTGNLFIEERQKYRETVETVCDDEVVSVLHQTGPIDPA